MKGKAMDMNENTQEMVKNKSCGCGGCSATNSDGGVEKVETYNEAASRRAYVPAVDILDDKSETVLIMDLPGVAEKDVDISVEKNVLTIKGGQTDADIADRQLVYSEYGVGDYHRSFVLSDDVDRENIAATLKDGVLKVKLPKVSPVSKKIAVGS